MSAVLAAPSYSTIGFSLYFAVRARRVRVPGGSKFHLEPGLIGADANMSVIFYKAVVQVVLLFGLKTWFMTLQINRTLG